MSMTIQEIIDKRRRSWEKRHDIKYDKEMIAAAIKYIHEDKRLTGEIVAKPWLLIEVAFTIVNKKKKTVPFFLNEVQRDIIRNLENNAERKPIFVLKGRQQGVTAVITAIQLCYAIVRRNFSGFTVADCNDNTQSIFNDKAKVPYSELPATLKPHEKYNNRREFFFDKLNSSWRIATASAEIGRSKTIEFCHFSEVAFYACPLSDLQKSIGEAFVDGAIVVYETTANGYNEAKDLWDSGTCINLFYRWWQSEEYTSENLTVLTDLSDSWISDRVEWLREQGLSEQRIAWYVAKYNSYLDKDSIKQEYPCFPEEAFLSSGECEFGNEFVTEQINRIRNLQAVKKGYFQYRKQRTQDIYDVSSVIISDVTFVEDATGPITIHTEPEISDKGKKPYSIGGDTAGDGSDAYTAKVIDNITGKTVATYRQKNTDDDLYAEQIYCLGKYYNDAIVGIEINFSYAPTKRLLDCSYPNLYMRERLDSITNNIDKKYGFKTTAQTRPVIIAELKRKWRESYGTIEVDYATLSEMLVFVKNDSGKPEAMRGKHDDLVMALAIAHHVSEQGSHEWQEEAKPIGFIEEMFPEYNGKQQSESEEYLAWS